MILSPYSEDRNHEHNIRYLESYQSLLHLLAFPEMQEEPVTGFDKGGFIAIVGVKKK